MKLKIVTFGIALVSAISTPTMASMGGNNSIPAILEKGISSTQILANGHPKRLQVNIDQPTTLNVTSEHFPGISSQGSHITGTLYDASGQRIAEASSPNGHFLIQRQLRPGNYLLEISGWSPGGNTADLRNRYELHATY
ncbi:carboxypeptidase-like regulatory domain-containing protein [Halomonas sp. NCCP-2165]|nr:carboxypeptidase-like regulatory domain-containing protein [Halomonas sp. NCCP-2165]GKW50512.1 hypothetical protein NCCP2165_27270 [Halomonas sp. NCCP-2165]